MAKSKGDTVSKMCKCNKGCIAMIRRLFAKFNGE